MPSIANSIDASAAAAELNHVRRTTNRRVVFTAPGEVSIQEEPVTPPGRGQILIETRRSLISTGTELAHLAGPPWKNPGGRNLPVYPHASGYSNAGVVAAVGPAVMAWRPGDRVASSVRHASYALLHERDWCIRVPDAVSDEAATFCTLATTVLNGLRIGAPQLGEDVVVIGMGLLGQLLVQYLRLSGCRTVVAVDVAASRLTIARRAGAATHCLDPAVDDVVGVVRDLTGGRGADIVYEVTGRTATFDLAFELARFHGRVVGLGSPRQPAPVDMQQVHMKALRVLGAIVASHPAEEDRQNRWSRRANGDYVMGLLASGRLDVHSLITDRFPAAEAPHAFASLLAERERHLGVILDWQAVT